MFRVHLRPLRGCNNFQAQQFYNVNSTFVDLSGEDADNISMIVDNTFYPCNGGAYQSEIYLYQMIDVVIEENSEYLFVVKIGTSFCM